jgi:mRNA interferase HigB
LEVRIVSEKAIKEFTKKYSDSVASLEGWRRNVRSAAWKSGEEVKAAIASSDLVGDKTVFNIAQNRYRLIAFISFRRQVVYIKAILTHKEYDKGEWKK